MSIQPKLGFFDLTMIVVSLVIGIGIFRTPAIVAQKAGSPGIFFTAWLLGGMISICGALTFAEIGSRFPEAGGFYKVFSYCYHPAYAFMLNWSLVVINAASAVGVALVGAQYLCPVLFQSSHATDPSVKITAVVVILSLFALNYLGIKTGARTQNALSLVKIITLLIFCLALAGNYHSASSIAASKTDKNFGFLKALGVSLISIFFTYGGYQNTINFGADIKNPVKNIPRAIFTGMGIVIILYLIINFAYYSVLGFTNLQNSKLPAAELAEAFFGRQGGVITSIAIFISAVGFINTSLMSNPRVYYAMADDKVLPGVFKRVNRNTMTQEFALTFFLVLMLVSLLLLGTFEKIINYVMFIDSLSLISAAGTIFIFRSRESRETSKPAADIYKMRLFPFVPVLFMLVLLGVTISVFLSDTTSAVYGIIIFFAGYPLYLLMKKVIPQKDL